MIDNHNIFRLRMSKLNFSQTLKVIDIIKLMIKLMTQSSFETCVDRIFGKSTLKLMLFIFIRSRK